jgi:molybdopterin-binding protein
MLSPMELLKVSEAAREVSISYPTLKQWIYRGKVRSVKTPGGHHRIPRSEIDRLTGGPTGKSRRPSGLSAISGRNKLLGTVTDVQIEGLLAQVALNIGGQTITSIITRKACEELGLKKGVRALALVKATEVMLIRG